MLPPPNRPPILSQLLTDYFTGVSVNDFSATPFCGGSSRQNRSTFAPCLRVSSTGSLSCHFPHVNGDVQNQLFNLRIWTGDPATTLPIYERELLKPFYANNVFDTLQGFTTYKLQDFVGAETPVFIPEGDFYVGWMQVTPGQLGIPMGFDVQNQCDCNYSNINGQWKKFPGSIKGSLMIRPVFSTIAPDNTSTGTKEMVRDASEVVGIFPNPSKGELNFFLVKGQLEDFRVVVFNQLGQVLVVSPMKAQIRLEGANNGIYFLLVENLKTGELFRHKLIVNTDRP